MRNLFFLLLALPLMFVACEENAPVDEVKNPTVSIETGASSPEAISFTVTSTEATAVAWVVVEAAEAVPTASEVLANGESITPNEAVACTAEALKAGTEYRVVAAAQNSAAVVKSEALIATQPAGGDIDTPSLTLKSEGEMSFTADGGNGEIKYELKNAVDDTTLTATSEATWISNITVGETITFVVAANEAEAREGVIAVAYGDLSFEVKVKQAAKGETPQPEVDVEFKADVLDVEYFGMDGSTAYSYSVYLSDNGLDSEGNWQKGTTYYIFDIYSNISSSASNGELPKGTYIFSDSREAGTLNSNGEYSLMIALSEQGIPTYGMYEDATFVISDNKIEATILMHDGKRHHVVYEGSLSWDNGSVDPDVDAQYTATSWTWGGSTSYGNKYAVVGEGFSLDVHFPVQYATESGLAAGEYIWTNTSWWGYNDFENEFTTRSFLVDGAYSDIIKKGSAVVERDGDEYSILLTLQGDNEVYVIEYNGTITYPGQGGGDDESDEVVFTKMESLGYNTSYWFYEFRLTNDNGDQLDLCVNDCQATESFIYTDDTFEWISIGYCGNLGYFSTRNVKLGGTDVKASSGSMVVVTDEYTYHMDITINLLMNVGGTKTFKFSGKVGEDNGGGDTPAEPTKLATPSVSGLVSGNSATVSWQSVAGAKDYTVTLNGSIVNTVAETYIVYTDLAYETTYSVSVVANPADTAVNTASDAGTASFTTEAESGNGGNEGGDDSGDEGGSDSNNATLKYVSNLSDEDEYGAGYDIYCYYELTSGNDVVRFYMFNNHSDKTILYDGTYTQASSLNGVAYNPSTQIHIDTFILDGVNNGGVQASTTMVVTNSGANVELNLDYNVIGVGVQSKKYVFAGTIE